MASNNSWEEPETVEITELNAIKSITNNEEVFEKARADSSDEKREKSGHHFSEPWEDSDVILVVENEKFHAHRLILSMNSPVFKAMFKSEFKEVGSNEIPLPRKKANEVLDFLKQLYVEEREEITFNNVEHLFKLSDEYQVKGILNQCIKFLETEPKTERSVMKILKLASLYKLENVRQDCFNTIKKMNLQSIRETSEKEDLDKETVEKMLSRRIEQLETFLDEVYPQFLGVVEYCIHLWCAADKNMKTCPLHFCSGKSRSADIDKRLGGCSVCEDMLLTMVKGTLASRFCYDSKKQVKSHVYGGSLHFDENLSSIIQEFSKLKSDS